MKYKKIGLSVILFFCFITNQIKSMHEQSINDKSDHSLVWNIKKQDQQKNLVLCKQNLKTRICKNCYKPTIALILLASVSFATYHFYEVLYESCDKMEDACGEASKNVPNILNKIEHKISPMLEFFENANNFIQQCPKATQDFMPLLIEFIQNCCRQQQ